MKKIIEGVGFGSYGPEESSIQFFDDAYASWPIFQAIVSRSIH
jgi:hypothetical protein